MSCTACAIVCHRILAPSSLNPPSPNTQPHSLSIFNSILQPPRFPISQALSTLQKPDLPALTLTHTHTPASNPKPNPTYTHTFCPRAPSATHIPHRPISATVLSLPPSPPLTPPLPRLPRLPLLPVLDLPLPPLCTGMRNRRGLYQTNSGISASRQSHPNTKSNRQILAYCPRK